MRLMSDRIQEFINWLANNTDYGDWDGNVQIRVHKKLIECMISDPVETCCGLPLTDDGHCRVSGEKIRK